MGNHKQRKRFKINDLKRIQLIMFGNGRVKTVAKESAQGNYSLIMKTETFTAEGSGTPEEDKGWSKTYEAPDGKSYNKLNPKFYEADHRNDTKLVTTVTPGETYFCTYDLAINGSVIEISANSFPGVYYVTGDKPRNCLLAA